VKIEDQRELVNCLYIVDGGNVERTATFVGGILPAVEVLLRRLGVERRSVVEFDTRPQLERPRLEVVGMAPGQREFRLQLALVVEIRQRVEKGRGGGFRRGVVYTHLERIEAGNIKLLTHGDTATHLL